jgi:hypothetical protein
MPIAEYGPYFVDHVRASCGGVSQRGHLPNVERSCGWASPDSQPITSFNCSAFANTSASGASSTACWKRSITGTTSRGCTALCVTASWHIVETATSLAGCCVNVVNPLLDVRCIDHQDFDEAASGLQFESEFLLERREQRRTIGGRHASRRVWHLLWRVLKLNVPCPRETRFVNHHAIDPSSQESPSKGRHGVTSHDPETCGTQLRTGSPVELRERRQRRPSSSTARLGPVSRAITGGLLHLGPQPPVPSREHQLVDRHLACLDVRVESEPVAQERSHERPHG